MHLQPPGLARVVAPRPPFPFPDHAFCMAETRCICISCVANRNDDSRQSQSIISWLGGEGRRARSRRRPSLHRRLRAPWTPWTAKRGALACGRSVSVALTTQSGGGSDNQGLARPAVSLSLPLPLPHWNTHAHAACGCTCLRRGPTHSVGLCNPASCAAVPESEATEVRAKKQVVGWLAGWFDLSLTLLQRLAEEWSQPKLLRHLQAIHSF